MITLTGKPISTQHAYKQHGKIRFMTKEAKALKEQYQWEAKGQWPTLPITGNIEIEIRIYFSDHRIRDWDNWHKLSCDSLSGIVYIDDSQIRRAIVELDYDKENPRIEIKVKTI